MSSSCRALETSRWQLGMEGETSRVEEQRRRLTGNTASSWSISIRWTEEEEREGRMGGERVSREEEGQQEVELRRISHGLASTVARVKTMATISHGPSHGKARTRPVTLHQQVSSFLFRLSLRC